MLEEQKLGRSSGGPFVELRQGEDGEPVISYARFGDG